MQRTKSAVQTSQEQSWKPRQASQHSDLLLWHAGRASWRPPHGVFMRAIEFPKYPGLQATGIELAPRCRADETVAENSLSMLDSEAVRVCRAFRGSFGRYDSCKLTVACLRSPFFVPWQKLAAFGSLRAWSSPVRVEAPVTAEERKRPCSCSLDPDYALLHEVRAPSFWKYRTDLSTSCLAARFRGEQKSRPANASWPSPYFNVRS